MDLREKVAEAESAYKRRIVSNYTVHEVSRVVSRIGGDPEIEKIVAESFLSPWSAGDRLRTVFLSLLVKNANVLLMGSYGTGKTRSAELLKKMVNGLDIVRIQGSVDKEKSQFAGVLDIEKLLTKKKFDVMLPSFTESPERKVLFIDEINRMSPYELNFLTAVTAERLVEVEEGLTDRSKSGVYGVDGLTVFATRNREDDATFPIPYHMLDRFHVSVLMDPVVTGVLDLKTFLYRDRDEDIRPLLTIDDILEARQQVSSVRVSSEVTTYLEAVLMQMQCGVFGGQREFCVGGDPCSKCPHSSEVCSLMELDFYPSGRSALQIMEFARANAYISGRDEVTIDDVRPYVFANLAHKIRFKSDAFQMVMGNPEMKELLPVSSKIASAVSAFDLLYVCVETMHRTAMDMLQEMMYIKGAINNAIIAGKKQAVEEVQNILYKYLVQQGNRTSPIIRWLIGRIMMASSVSEEVSGFVQGKLNREALSDVARRIVDSSRIYKQKNRTESESTVMVSGVSP